MGLQLTTWIKGSWEWLYRSRRKLATGAVAVLAIQLAWHVIFGANGALVYHEKRSEYRKLQQETDQLQLENQKLQEHIQSLKSDPKAIEKEAREQLKYARPGEVVYTVPAPAPQTALATATAKKQ
ncbi:MAG: septum formation initiator family protein [Candidatus Koribacter versatilis]|uniref:Septum formation initiator family protein n=1 Tax=Candidatus Korobacter versatilis TaxID=658062 RepID=A0A932EPR6_9BACT|nr:septum formation initiator family protein [Candidatus Koribacter versatilis]